MKRNDLQTAWLLHQYDFRDSSRIAELFVREHGRVAVVARGVRAAKSRQRGLLQAFQPLLVSWSGRDLGTLTGVETGGKVRSLAGDALLAGFYLNELCLRLLAKHDPHPEIFDLYSRTIANLENQGDSVPVSLRLFEKQLLDMLGYGLVLEANPLTGEAVLPEAWYLFEPERGPQPISAARDHPLCVVGSSLLALADCCLETPQSLHDARRLLRAAIDIHLGGRPLKSRDVLRAMYRRSEADKSGQD